MDIHIEIAKHKTNTHKDKQPHTHKYIYITSFSKVAYLGRKCNDFADIIVLFNKKKLCSNVSH